jgi:HD-GYP domain-containing protein (c-di-GMP phosphodiesterase class II)
MMIDISIGLCSADARSIPTLLEEADRRMYLHKTDRRKRQVVETLLGLPTARPEVIDSVVSSLLASLYKKEPYGAEHARRVAFLTLVLSGDLSLSVSQIHSLLLAALLHDAGKASLPTELLQRPGPLTEAEKKAVHGHPAMAAEFFQGIPHLEESRALIRHHHERYDGQVTGEFPGYPAGMRGEAIPLGARILKLADSVDAMLQGRPYRPALPLAEVLEILRRESGASFDPRLVKILLHSERWGDEIGSSEALARLYETVTTEAVETDRSALHELHPSAAP